MQQPGLEVSGRKSGAKKKYRGLNLGGRWSEGEGGGGGIYVLCVLTCLHELHCEG